MSSYHRWRAGAAGLAIGWLLLACGGGSDPAPSASSTASSQLPQEPGAPIQQNSVATDGLNWINYRRAQAGMPQVARNALIDKAAQGHSDYQHTNNIVSHDQLAGKPGFTGAWLLDRLNGAGYSFTTSNFAYGEVISAANSSSGFYMAEELITAIFHRFVIFEPKFKEIGAGAATNSSGYTYFTSDFAAREGYGPGIGRGKFVGWPFDGQTKVSTNFFSDFESPDPVPNVNEVGYPISVHADIDVVLSVQSFTVRPRGGADLVVQLLKGSPGSDSPPQSAAAIIPMAVLKANTVYEVSFAGTADGTPVSRTWTFTTK
jgi:uncharacterized protein YkwD